MTYDEKADGFTLSTGRSLMGNGQFRLAPGDKGEVSYGYDGDALGFDMVALTPDERREIADYMIQAWSHWANTGETP